MVNYSGGIMWVLLVFHTSSLTCGEETGSWLIWGAVGLSWRSAEREACGLQKLLQQSLMALGVCLSKRQSTGQWERVACLRDSWGCAAVWQQHWDGFNQRGIIQLGPGRLSSPSNCCSSMAALHLSGLHQEQAWTSLKVGRSALVMGYRAANLVWAESVSRDGQFSRAHMEAVNVGRKGLLCVTGGCFCVLQHCELAAGALLLVWKKNLTCCESGHLGNSPAQVYLSVK